MEDQWVQSPQNFLVKKVFFLQLPHEKMTIWGAYSFQVSFDDRLKAAFRA